MSVLTSPNVVETKIHAVVGEFSDERELVKAGRKARAEGYTKIEAYSPFPVHGIDEAIGVPRSILGYIVLPIGLTGTASALFLIWWTGAVDYPLVIGGKPLFDITFSIPVTFELTILFSAFAAVLGMFALNGLPRLYHSVFNYSKFAGATDDKFLLSLEATDPLFEVDATSKFLRGAGATAVEVVEE